MKPDDEDWLDTPSIFDDPDEEDVEAEDRLSWQPGDFGFTTPTRLSVSEPQTYQEWLDAVDWRQVIDSLAEGERALTLLVARLSESPVKEAWRKRAALDEAVADCAIGGLTTKRARLMAVRGEIGLVKASTADLVAERVWTALVGRDHVGQEGPYFAYRNDNLTGNLFLRHELTQTLDPAPNVLDEQDTVVTLADPADELADMVAARESFDAWIEGVDRVLKDETRLVQVAAALWGLTQQIDVGDPIRLARFVAPALLARVDNSVARLPGPVFLSRGFMSRTLEWRPAGDPTRWLQGFCNGLGRACRIHLGEVALIEKRLEDVAKTTAGYRSNSRARQIAEYIAINDIAGVPDLRRHLSPRISKDKVIKNLKELARPDGHNGPLIHEISGRDRFHIWAYKDVRALDVMRGDTDIYASR